jgi:threonine dehydratase
LVDDEEIAAAILRLLERQKVLAEGAGAAGVAAMLHRKTRPDGKTAVVIGGGNIDVTLLSRIIERGLVKDGRLVRMRIPLPDHPGALQHLTAILAAQHANIIQVIHDRAYFGAHLGEGIVDITVETRGPEHVGELLQRLREAGYALERVR